LEAFKEVRFAPEPVKVVAFTSLSVIFTPPTESLTPFGTKVLPIPTA
jgi:hypothetical protein